MAERPPKSEERALWRAAMHGVAPLPKRGAAPASEPPAAAELPPNAAKVRSARRAVPRPPPAPRRPDLAPGVAPGVDRRSAERLRRGEREIEARLDLHGMTQDEAHRALNAFLDRAEHTGWRGVLVLTGKGRAGSSAAGVLRAAVPRWLNEAPNRARLLAIAAAQPKHGGAGAMYLLLRRKR
ncbi:MAG TPA: Smr/MutS family protein [Stellaceae bacterium]